MGENARTTGEVKVGKYGRPYNWHRVVGELGLTPGEVLWVDIVSSFDGENGAFPPHNRIAACAGMSRRWSAMTEAALQKKGMVKVTHQQEQRKGHIANQYDLSPLWAMAVKLLEVNTPMEAQFDRAMEAEFDTLSKHTSTPMEAEFDSLSKQTAPQDTEVKIQNKETSPARARRARSASSNGKEKSPVTILVDWMAEQYREAHGRAMTSHPPRDRKLIKDLLAQHPEEEIRENWVAYQGSQDAFYKRNGWNIPTFVMKYDAIALEEESGGYNYLQDLRLPTFDGIPQEET